MTLPESNAPPLGSELLKGIPYGVITQKQQYQSMDLDYSF